MSEQPLADEDRKALLAIAQHRRWSRVTDRTAATEKARRAGPGSLAYWEQRVDPDRVMSDATRAKAASNAKKAHYLELALKSARARRRGGDAA